MAMEDVLAIVVGLALVAWICYSVLSSPPPRMEQRGKQQVQKAPRPTAYTWKGFDEEPPIRPPQNRRDPAPSSAQDKKRRSAGSCRNLTYVPMHVADSQKSARKGRRIGDTEWLAGRTLATRKGDLVRSRPEVRVADHLYSRHIPYEYEPMICGFRPDFFLPSHGIIIEYWGMDEKGSTHRNRKTRAYLNAGYELISLGPGKGISIERDLDRQLWYKLAGA